MSGGDVAFRRDHEYVIHIGVGYLSNRIGLGRMFIA